MPVDFCSICQMRNYVHICCIVGKGWGNFSRIDKIEAVNKHSHLCWSLPWQWWPPVRPRLRSIRNDVYHLSLLDIIGGLRYCSRVYKYKCIDHVDPMISILHSTSFLVHLQTARFSVQLQSLTWHSFLLLGPHRPTWFHTKKLLGGPILLGAA